MKPSTLLLLLLIWFGGGCLSSFNANPYVPENTEFLLSLCEEISQITTPFETSLLKASVFRDVGRCGFLLQQFATASEGLQKELLHQSPKKRILAKFKKFMLLYYRLEEELNQYPLNQNQKQFFQTLRQKTHQLAAQFRYLKNHLKRIYKLAKSVQTQLAKIPEARRFNSDYQHFIQIFEQLKVLAKQKKKSHAFFSRYYKLLRKWEHLSAVLLNYTNNQKKDSLSKKDLLCLSNALKDIEIYLAKEILPLMQED